MNSEQIKKAIENNSNYWERRALENKLNIIENEEDYIKRISAIFDKANRDIDDKLAAIYTRYAKENKMTLNEAYQILPKKMETEYKADVMDYIEKAKSGDTKWKQYLLNQSIMHKHSVLDQLRTEYRNVIYNIDMETTGGKFLEKIYANANYYEQYSNNEENFARVDQDKIKRLLEEDWSGGGNFSEAIWKNKEQLINALDDIVIRGLATGESYDKMADRLAKRMETSKSNAKRLIMTESARMDNEGLLARYKETDVKNLIFVATLDMRTSEICQAMDGEIIPIENAQVGLNIPPMHPYCRSVISPYYEDNVPETRMYRDKDTGKSTKGDYKDYVDYLERHLGDKKQAKALASKKNDLQTLLMAVNTTVDVLAPESVNLNELPKQEVIKEELTEEEKEAIYNYSNDDYFEINKYLRGQLKDIPETYKKEIKLLDNALNKMENYEGEVSRGLLFHEQEKLDDFINSFKEGDIKLFKEYLSTSHGRYYHYNTTNVTFIIKSKTGKKIENYAKYKDEQEVLFRRNTTFFVLMFDFKKLFEEDDSYRYVIELEEVILND